MQYLEQAFQEHLGFWAHVPSYRQYEGSSWSLNRPDGSIVTGEFMGIEGVLTVSADEVPTLTPDKVKEKLREAALTMARQTSQGFFKDLDEQLEQHGQVFDAKGQPLDKEIFLRTLDSLQIEFDEQGEPILPALMMHPQMAESIKAEMQQWDNDPEFIKRHRALIQRKRMEWRDRESRRKLVD